MKTDDNLPKNSVDGQTLVLARTDIWAGLFFCAIGLFGLWASRDYTIGTAVRMGTGYFPRLICWILCGLGIAIFALGLFRSQERVELPANWRPLIAIPTAILLFAFTIEKLGVFVAGALLIGIGSLARKEWRLLETTICVVVVVFVTWAIFVAGLSLPIPVWPEV